MAPPEARGSKEQFNLSSPIILASSEIHKIKIKKWGEERVIDGRVVIGAKKLTVDGSERFRSGLGIPR